MNENSVALATEQRHTREYLVKAARCDKYFEEKLATSLVVSR